MMKLVRFLIVTVVIIILSTECFGETVITGKMDVKKTTAKKPVKSKTKKKPIKTRKKKPQENRHSIYFSLSAVPFKIDNLDDMDITDFFDDEGNFQYVGNEGRKSLNTGSLNQNVYLYGFMMGYKYMYGTKYGFAGDFTFHTNNGIYLYSLYAGFEYKFKITPKYYIGLMPKIGYSLFVVNLSDIETESGYSSSTVIFKDKKAEAEIKNGDPIYAYSHTISLQLLFTGAYHISNNVDLNGNIGIIFAKFPNLNYFSNYTFIDGNSRQVVKHSTYIKSDSNEKIQTIGITANIGASYKL